MAGGYEGDRLFLQYPDMRREDITERFSVEVLEEIRKFLVKGEGPNSSLLLGHSLLEMTLNATLATPASSPQRPPTPSAAVSTAFAAAAGAGLTKEEARRKFLYALQNILTYLDLRRQEGERDQDYLNRFEDFAQLLRQLQTDGTVRARNACITKGYIFNRYINYHKALGDIVRENSLTDADLKVVVNAFIVQVKTKTDKTNVSIINRFRELGGDISRPAAGMYDVTLPANGTALFDVTGVGPVPSSF
jgi:hypothetical protein